MQTGVTHSGERQAATVKRRKSICTRRSWSWPTTAAGHGGKGLAFGIQKQATD